MLSRVFLQSALAYFSPNFFRPHDKTFSSNLSNVIPVAFPENKDFASVDFASSPLTISQPLILTQFAICFMSLRESSL